MEISVIVPVYNKEKYISRILGDISNQSFEDFECIIVDDGSADSSGEICDEFAAKDERFCVLHIPNGGVSHARNIGLTRATGKYVTFIDADDHIEPDYLMRLYTDMESSRADMVVAGLKKFWEDGRPPVTTEVPYDGVQSIKQLMPEFAQVQKRTGIYGYGCGKLIRRDLIADTRFSEWLHLAEDFEFYLRVYPRVKTVYFDDLCKYYYLQEADNSSAIVNSADIDYLAQLKVNLSYRSFLQNAGYYIEKNREIVDALIANYAFFSIFHCVREQIPAKVDEVHSLLIENDFRINGRGLLQLVILFCVQHDMKKSPQVIMKVYDTLRALKRRL